MVVRWEEHSLGELQLVMRLIVTREGRGRFCKILILEDFANSVVDPY